MWSPLPGAEREVRSVSRLFSPHTLLLGDQASEERLADMNRRGELAKYRFLLFSWAARTRTASLWSSTVWFDGGRLTQA